MKKTLKWIYGWILVPVALSILIMALVDFEDLSKIYKNISYYISKDASLIRQCVKSQTSSKLKEYHEYSCAINVATLKYTSDPKEAIKLCMKYSKLPGEYGRTPCEDAIERRLNNGFTKKDINNLFFEPSNNDTAISNNNASAKSDIDTSAKTNNTNNNANIDNSTLSKKTDWKTYTKVDYKFSFKYPGNIFAYDEVDHTNGQIPDVAGFGQHDPEKYDAMNRPPDNKSGSARILVWKNVSQDLKSWLKKEDSSVKENEWTDVKIGGIDAVFYSLKNKTFYTKKTYYIKYGNNIMGILGSSPTNQYSDKWIEAFDEIVQTFQFTK